MNPSPSRRRPSFVRTVTLCVAGLAVALIAAGPAAADEQPTRLRITNQCPYPLWIQQDFQHPTSDPVVRQVAAGHSLDYAIPDEGLPSTRFWAKASCNDFGYDCAIGESTGVPAAQKAKHQTVTLFDPPIDSKFEATWGCLLADSKQCAVNPSSQKQEKERLDGWTWWNGSLVDGYTFPFAILAKTPGVKCYDQRSGALMQDASVHCGGLDPALCPTAENLSTDGEYDTINGVKVTSVDLQLGAVSDETKLIGCLSPCTKLTQSSRGGWGAELGNLVPGSDEARMYCCPTPPVEPDACSAGPVAQSQYLKSTQEKQKCDAYAYAYDDAQGLAKCEGPMKFEIVYCPGGKALPLPPKRSDAPPPVLCDPTAEPKQLCPGGIPCPDCGGTSCECPPPPAGT